MVVDVFVDKLGTPMIQTLRSHWNAFFYSFCVAIQSNVDTGTTMKFLDGDCFVDFLVGVTLSFLFSFLLPPQPRLVVIEFIVFFKYSGIELFESCDCLVAVIIYYDDLSVMK